MAGARIPLPSNDFRALSPLEYHWNDPPQKIFHKHVDSDHPIDAQYVKEVVMGVLAECKQLKSGSAQKRVLADTERRIKGFVDQLDKGEIDARLVSSLGELCEGEWLNRLRFLKEQGFWLGFS
ncbi:hypothetical protein BC937DRAFT_91098 [Endogone sp. FLAS-F59071]|nr:hypothetical protein BC937DRAFT_91098 [Endogone sp. FLAS-F59071]|eukprot:RUS16537.1 hypothetical protein BC937DRAFT_91098 [Endogone sp. FLAS-F59071]